MINQLINAREELLQRVDEQYTQRFINLFQLQAIIKMEIMKRFEQRIQCVRNIQNNFDHPLQPLNVPFDNIGFVTNIRYIFFEIFYHHK